MIAGIIHFPNSENLENSVEMYIVKINVFSRFHIRKFKVIYIHLSLYIYICVCVCVCVCIFATNDGWKIEACNNIVLLICF